MVCYYLCCVNLNQTITNMGTKVVIYARGSTKNQDYDRQLSELREYASRMDYEVVQEFAEKISGAKSVAERQALTELLDYTIVNNVDKVLISECSRLSRKAIDFLGVINKKEENSLKSSSLVNLCARRDSNPHVSRH